jgi:hypothetical protein
MQLSPPVLQVAVRARQFPELATRGYAAGLSSGREVINPFKPNSCLLQDIRGTLPDRLSQQVFDHVAMCTKHRIPVGQHRCKRTGRPPSSALGELGSLLDLEAQGGREGPDGLDAADVRAREDFLDVQVGKRRSNSIRLFPAARVERPQAIVARPSPALSGTSMADEDDGHSEGPSD